MDPGTTGHFRQVQRTLAKACNVFCRTSQNTDYRFTPEERKVMVYVLAKDGSPLMPTKHHGKVRHLLENGKAVCVRRTPFTIRLLYDTPGRTQPVSLGVDAGAKMVGLSACTEKEELFAAECELRTDINKNLEQRRSLRSARRSRKTRYPQAAVLKSHEVKEERMACSFRCGKGKQSSYTDSEGVFHPSDFGDHNRDGTVRLAKAKGSACWKRSSIWHRLSAWRSRRLRQHQGLCQMA